MQTHWQLPDPDKAREILARLSASALTSDSDDPGLAKQSTRFDWPLAGLLLAGLVMMGLTGWFAYRAGYERGFMAGYDSKHQVEAQETQHWKAPE